MRLRLAKSLNLTKQTHHPMSKLKQDPESFLTPDKISYMPKIGGVNERLKGKVGFHQFELCLLRTYWMTERYFNNNTIDRVDMINHLFSLKAGIIRYCMPHGLDWKELMSRSQVYLVVVPDYTSSMFYRLMADNLFILDETTVSRFLDYHLVNTVLKFKDSKERSAKEIDKTLIRFIQEIDYHVMFALENAMPLKRDGVIHEVKEWVRNQMNQFTEAELVEYHAYEFDPETNNDYKPFESVSQAHLLTSCSPAVLKDYFLLLTNKNPEATGNVPFVSTEKVNYILNEWFGIGDKTPERDDSTVTIDRPQLLYFLYNFKLHFCMSRKSGMVKSEDLIRLALTEFDELFLGVEMSNQVQNFKRDATRKNAYHRSLDFKQYPSVMKSYEELKKSKTT
jgi:hypothetical protein